ncbi:MAG: dihydroorotate dehydrogenase [Candidatus Omnitrophica bacterium]|nr:dihydroorotate dehydrogenase [Candidatus Omnitrophota bacterium]
MPIPPLRVTIGTLVLPNPVLAAAGTFGYGVEFARAAQLARLGGLITKTLTRLPREGHPPPRLVETPSGMLNAVGLQNIGLAAFLEEKLPPLRAIDVPLIVSILGESPEEAAELTRQLDRADGVDAIELNLSCPNVHHRHTAHSTQHTEDRQWVAMVAQDAQLSAQFVHAARQATKKPIIAKLSPDVTDLRPIAQAAEAAGADALTLSNTYVGMSLDPATRRSRLSTLTGGLSGPAIRPLSLYRVWYTAASIRVPIIGLGGIARAEDAIEYLLAGASAVAVGTANFANPRAAIGVVRGIEHYMHRHRLNSLKELRGTHIPKATEDA